MIQFDVFSLLGITTDSDIRDLYFWCVSNIGQPDGRIWAYGRHADNFVGSRLINCPEEIEYLEFADSEDATMFKLKYGCK